MKKTGVLFFPAFDWAISPTHPEREERLLYTRDQLFEEGLMDLPNIKEYRPELCSPKDIFRVHFSIPDLETHLTEAHFIAAGSTLILADAVLNKEVDNAFAIVRPPGHHAMTVTHGNRGFCNINNEAIMVEYIRKKYGLRKIAIIDTDVHHGDGTQEIFYNDPDVLFISFHQDGRTLYPGSGFIDELGGPLAYGTTINIPLLPRTTDEGIHYVLDNLILPILEDFKPELIVNSAGQDNHFTDPLAEMAFTAQGYALLNSKLAPDIAVLEGGYSVETALPYVNAGILMAMAGIDYSNLKEPGFVPGKLKEPPGNMEHIKKIVELQKVNYFTRHEVIEQFRKDSNPYRNEYNRIFYDTDYIHEEQNNMLRICKKCLGFRTIKSTAQQRSGKLYTVFCITIPIYACDSCQKEARQAYQDMINNGRFDLVYLQDRAKDEYRIYDCDKEMEKVY